MLGEKRVQVVHYNNRKPLSSSYVAMKLYTVYVNLQTWQRNCKMWQILDHILVAFIFWFIPAHWCCQELCNTGNSQDNLCIGNLGEKVGLLGGCVQLFFFFKLVGHYISDHNVVFLPGIMYVIWACSLFLTITWNSFCNFYQICHFSYPNLAFPT
jgi:hypothetical protein